MDVVLGTHRAAVENKGDYRSLQQVLWDNDYFSEPEEGDEEAPAAGEDSTS